MKVFYSSCKRKKLFLLYRLINLTEELNIIFLFVLLTYISKPKIIGWKNWKAKGISGKNIKFLGKIKKSELFWSLEDKLKFRGKNK